MRTRSGKSQKHEPSQQKAQRGAGGRGFASADARTLSPHPSPRQGAERPHARGVTWEARVPKPPEPAARVAAPLARPSRPAPIITCSRRASPATAQQRTLFAAAVTFSFGPFPPFPHLEAPQQIVFVGEILVGTYLELEVNCEGGGKVRGTD